MTDSYIDFTLKMKSVSKNTIFGLKMMEKSGLEKIFLKFLHAGDYFPLLHKSAHTLSESENERQKIEPVPIPLPSASRNFPDVKTRNDFFFHNWTSEIISFIRFGMQMDRT